MKALPIEISLDCGTVVYFNSDCYPRNGHICWIWKTLKTDADINLAGYWYSVEVEVQLSRRRCDQFISSLAQSSRDVVKDPTGHENYLLEVDEPDCIADQQKNSFPVPFRRRYSRLVGARASR